MASKEYLAVKCPRCDGPIAPSDVFCGNCGSTLSPAAHNALASGWTYVSAYDRDHPLTVRPRQSLAERSATAVVLGHAFDGLPLVLDVERRASIERAVLAALGQPPKDRLAPAIADALGRLEAAVGGIATIEDQRVYRSVRMVGQLLGDTVLVKAIGGLSPLMLVEALPLLPPSLPSGGTTFYPVSSVHARVSHTTAGPVAPPIPAPLPPLPMMASPPGGPPGPPPFALPSEPPPQAMNVTVGQRRLAVPLTENAPFIVSETTDGAEAGPSTRPLLLEDLRGLADARFHFCLPNGNVGEGALADAEVYAVAVLQAQLLAWSVSRADLGRALAQLGRTLDGFHREARIHGDVKPANTLLTGAGPTPIDETNTAVGAVSPAMTPGWAAPEQILARPVNPATDVYALGLMAAGLVGGAIYGEERTFIIATGGHARQRVQILASGGIYLDPQALALDEAGRTAWQQFISRCLAFEPEARPADGAQFADLLEELLERHALPGRLAITGGPGVLRRNVDVLGEIGAAWIVSDGW